jgi:hypothetical protein
MFLRGCDGDDIAESIEDVKERRISNPEALPLYRYKISFLTRVHEGVITRTLEPHHSPYPEPFIAP